MPTRRRADSTVNYSYNAGDELCNSSTSSTSCSTPASTSTRFVYATNGERTSATAYSAGTAGSATYYAWNAYGQLCNVASAATACGSTPSSGMSYQYNGDGERTVATTATSTTDSTWDNVSGASIPLNVNDATTTSSGTTNTSYVYGNLLFGGTAPVEQISGSTATFLVANQTGVQGVYGSSGSPVELAVYSTYGNQTISSGSKVTSFGFQGSYTDSTGLVYLINRYYDPTTDEFLSVDPDAAMTNQPYVFTGDDPLNEADPLGLYDCAGKSPSHIAARYTRNGQAINLVCGVRNRPGQTGYGVVHIQEDNKHFGGDLSELALRDIGVTIARGKPTDPRGATIAYVMSFVVLSNSMNLPEPETYTIRVIVDNQYGTVTSARIEEPIVDQNQFDGCHFAGINLCQQGGFG